MANDKTKLTDKQKLFVQELIKNGYNATQAALAAGYSEKSAYAQGSRLLKNDEVLKYKDELLNSLQQPTIATIEEILQYYTRVMRREEKENVVVTIKEKVSGMVLNPDTGKRERKTVEKETPKIVEIPTRVADANKAAEMLGKNYGIWTDKVNVESDEKEININIRAATPEDMEEA